MPYSLEVAGCILLATNTFCADVRLRCRTLACWAIASQVWHPFETNQLLFYSDSKSRCLELIETFHFL